MVPRFELFEAVAALVRVVVDLGLLAVALCVARFLTDDVFARGLVGCFLERLLRAPITAPDTAPIKVPTTGVPTAVPTTAPATAPPSVLLAAPFASLDKISFLSLLLISGLLSSSYLVVPLKLERRQLAADQCEQRSCY